MTEPSINKQHNDYDVIVIGGGITGVGTARDCALRGLKVLLVEQRDFAHGASGRNHGLLHSGARYAVTDRSSAAECIGENITLRRIAPHCVEETDGLFVTLPDDDLAYQSTFVEACHAAGIKAEVIAPEEALRIEPAVNSTLIGAVRVPDAAVNPFKLTISNVLDAQAHGATVLTYHEVTDLIVNQARVEGVVMRNMFTGEKIEARGKITINAAGIWGTLIARMAGVTINMYPAKGSLLVFAQRVNKMVINRCRKPANADILVPDENVCLIGTTSDRVPIETVDDMRVTPQEVDELLREGTMLAPALANTRILRAYAGVRPLVANDSDPSGRSISRGTVCLDHAKRDGLEGFITITGGKMMTYRLMAEEVTNLACEKLGVQARCETAERLLPDAKPGNVPDAEKKRYDMGTLVCVHEKVSVGDVDHALDTMHVSNLHNLRRRTRMGMGVCQGHWCACRAAGLLCKRTKAVETARCQLRDFLDERWKGISPVAWGKSLAEAQLTTQVYAGLCGMKPAKQPNTGNND